MTSSENTPRLGLVDLPTLSGPLTAAGFQLFGGGPFREAAAEIKSAAEQGPVAAIFVADSPQPGIKAWLTRMTTHGAVVVILRSDLPRLEVDGARSVDLPATVGELLAAAGLTSTSAAAAVGIDVDGAVTVVDSPIDSPAPAKAKTPAKTPAKAKAPTVAQDPAPAAQPVEPTPAETAPTGVTGFGVQTVQPPTVQASPILFAAQRRGAHPVPVEESVADAPAAPAPVGASPWDDEAPTSVPAAIPVAAAVAPAPVAVSASPWDDPPAAVEPKPYLPPRVAQEEDWFGQPAVVATSHTQQPAVAAPAPQPRVPSGPERLRRL